MVRMRTYLISLGFDIWKFVVDGYKMPTTPQSDHVGKKARVNNTKAMNAI